MFFTGITPPLHEPTVTTINAPLDPLVEQLQVLYSGQCIQTYWHPNGTVKKVAVLPAIGDLLATQRLLAMLELHCITFALSVLSRNQTLKTWMSTCGGLRLE
ncbi:hypothetical protein P691DRAFT_769355 [Macrolepiota fuliginosa MF-IS2]|uniref:Uncharacterized protein n=1 Tax=Macrolepiota fuliginosa MF-IS2 TaxID=1400762 RepID=A0A9P5WVZ7_9AGAR|nr:hypothetical protein P691DRAFT_769355 [Macrolepiota fuliginosa MF-IS2]